jgi:hypothetical protein
MRKNEKRKSQLQIATPEDKRRIWASIPIANLSTNTIKNSAKFLTSLMNYKLTLREREEIRVRREVREMEAPSSYLTGLLHNLSFAPGYN